MLSVKPLPIAGQPCGHTRGSMSSPRMWLADSMAWLSPRSPPALTPLLRSITPARAHTLALEPMPPRRGHVKSLSGFWLAGSPWIWHCAQIYLPDLGVALRMGWIRSFQEVHFPRALDFTLRAFNNPGVRNSLSCALHAVTALMYDRPMQPARG